jgi:hypothetical protein
MSPRISFNSSRLSTRATTRFALPPPSTDVARLVNLRSSDARESGRSASPSAISTVSRKELPSAQATSTVAPRPFGNFAISASDVLTCVLATSAMTSEAGQRFFSNCAMVLPAKRPTHEAVLALRGGAAGGLAVTHSAAGCRRPFAGCSSRAVQRITHSPCKHITPIGLAEQLDVLINLATHGDELLGIPRRKHHLHLRAQCARGLGQVLAVYPLGMIMSENSRSKCLPECRISNAAFPSGASCT